MVLLRDILHVHTWAEPKGCWDGSSCWCCLCSTAAVRPGGQIVSMCHASSSRHLSLRHREPDNAAMFLAFLASHGQVPSIHLTLMQHAGAGVDPRVEVGNTRTGWESNPQPPCWTSWTASLFPEETHEALSSGMEAEHSRHSFNPTNPNLAIKPWRVKAATLLGPGKASSVTWLHKSAPNETTQQAKLLEHSSFQSLGVFTCRNSPQIRGLKTMKRQRHRGGDLITFYTFNIYNILVSLDSCVFLTCSCGVSFHFFLSLVWCQAWKTPQRQQMF